MGINFGLVDAQAPERMVTNALAMNRAGVQDRQNALNFQNQQEDRQLRNALAQQQEQRLTQRNGLDLIPRIAQLLYANPSDETVDMLGSAYSQATGKDVSQFVGQLKQMPPEQRKQIAMAMGQKADPNFQLKQFGNTVAAFGTDPMTGQIIQGGSYTVPESDLDRARADYYRAQAGKKDEPEKEKLPFGWTRTQEGELAPEKNGPFDPESPMNKAKADQKSGGKVLPATRLEDLADMKRVRDELGEIETFLLGDHENPEKKGADVDTGPVMGRMQSIGAKVGLAGDDFVNLQQKMSSVENIMLKLRSGAAVTEQEYERFKREYPNVNDPKETRNRKLKNAIKYASDLIDEKITMYEEGGYKVPTSIKGGTGKDKPSLDSIFGK